MSQLILEAFRELKGLKEDVFSFDKQGALELKDFLHADRKEPTEVEIIDPDADTEQDLQDSYDGEVILSCCACHGLIPKSPKEVVIDPDTQRANVDEPCPNCFNKVGYRVMAQIPSDEYQPEEEEEVDQTEEHSDDTLEIDTENITVEEADQESDQIEESMKKPITEAASVVPAPFDKYYQVASEEDSKALSEEDVDEVQWFKDEFGVDFIGWLTAKDQYQNALSQDGYEVAVLYKNNGVAEVGEVIGGRLFTLDFAEDIQPLVETVDTLTEKLKIDKDDDVPDLWDEVYAALGENGEQVKNPNSEKGTYRFNMGAGYGYERLSVDGDGNIVIRAASEKELEPAKAAVEPFADRGVTYEIKVSKHDKRRPYAIVVSIPADGVEGVDSVEECVEGSCVVEESKSKDFDIYYRDGEDSDWEHYDTIHNVADLNAYMDKFAEWLDDDSNPHWEYDEDTCIVSDGYGQEYRFEAVEDSLTESIENITVETNDDTITVKPSEDGKVSIDAEPKTADPGALEPVSPEVQAEIEANSEESAEGEEDTISDIDTSVDAAGEDQEEEEDVDITDFDEAQFDELGESYLKNVYDNVASFKTTKGYIDDNQIKLEGVIKFNSGKQAKTSFLFESFNVTKRGKYKFIGENIQITNRKNAFILAGDIKEGNFLPESLTYNYNAKDATTGKSKKVYGTVRSKK